MIKRNDTTIKVREILSFAKTLDPFAVITISTGAGSLISASIVDIDCDVIEPYEAMDYDVHNAIEKLWGTIYGNN